MHKKGEVEAEEEADEEGLWVDSQHLGGRGSLTCFGMGDRSMSPIWSWIKNAEYFQWLAEVVGAGDRFQLWLCKITF